MKPMFHPDDLASMDPLVLMKNLDHVRMTSRRLSYVLQQQVHLYTPEANRLREEIDTYVEAERQIEGEMSRRAIRACSPRGASGTPAAIGPPSSVPESVIRARVRHPRPNGQPAQTVAGVASSGIATTASPRRAVDAPRRTARGSSAITAATSAESGIVSNRLNPIPSSPSSTNP